MKMFVVVIMSAAVVSGCTDAAVSKAIGTGADAAAPLIVVPSASGVTVENHTGRPLLNVRITIDAGGSPAYLRVLPTMDTGATVESLPADFHTEEGALLDLATVHPTQVAVAARDTVSKSYAITVPWTP